MFRLRYVKGHNLLGIKSGLGRKDVELDLSEYLDKDIIVFCGENASGKSTLLSILHPTVWPIDGRRKFIIPGKEGYVTREYVDDDGTVMVSKCIYHPKKDSDGHSPSCYLSMKSPGMDEEVELNPNGNTSSYKDLLYTYFGITDDFLSFATFSSSIANIVRMNDTERKNSVSTMTPNVKKFEVAFDILNGKYRDIRTTLKNIAQKITSIRDEESLRSDLKRLTKEVKQYSEDREDRIKKIAKIDGRLKEITGGKGIDELAEEHQRAMANSAAHESSVSTLASRLKKLYKKLDIDTRGPDSLAFDESNMIQAYITKYSSKAAEVRATKAIMETTDKNNRERLHKLEHEINEIDSILYSLRSQDVGDLEDMLNQYMEQIAGLRYTNHIDEYQDKSYDECIQLGKVVTMVDRMVSALYDEYGELVTEYFSTVTSDDYIVARTRNMEALTVSINTNSVRRDRVYRKMIENEQYLKVRDVLSQRPKACVIDDCPFIATALKYQDAANEVAALSEEYKSMSLTLEDDSAKLKELQHALKIQDDAQRLIQYINDNATLFNKYFGISDITTIYKAIAKAKWTELLDAGKLKVMAAILSEKDLYIQIVNQKIPEIKYLIESAKLHGANKDLLTAQRSRLKDEIDDLKETIRNDKSLFRVNDIMEERYQKNAELWREVDVLLRQYEKALKDQVETNEVLKAQDEKLELIAKLGRKKEEESYTVAELDRLIMERVPLREKLKLDLDAVLRLNIDKLEAEREFTIINIIRSIVAPGKGIRKELISLYLSEIRTIANQLLLNTFDGKLYLEDFIITDKEFQIPYTYNGEIGTDIAYASSAQQSMITTSLSLALLSHVMDKYGVLVADELDAALNPKNKSEFIPFFRKQAQLVGVAQTFMVTQSSNIYIPHNPLFVTFPGSDVKGHDLDVIDI